MNGPLTTYVIMFATVVALTMCVLYLSKRSDVFEDEADLYYEIAESNYAAWATTNDELIEANKRNAMLESLLDLQLDDLFRPLVHIHQGGTQNTYCGVSLPTTAPVVAWEDAESSTCSGCTAYFTDTPVPSPAQPTLFGHTGIGYLEYTD